MRDYFIYSFYRLAGSLARHLSPRVAYGTAGWLGWLLYVLSPGLRRNYIHNMQHVLGSDAPPSQVRAHARRICANLIKGYYELFRLDRLSADEILSRVKFEGVAYAEEALARGRGGIVGAIHFGNVDMVAQFPVLKGVPVTSVVEHIRPERLYSYVLRLRTSHGLRMVPSDGPMLSLFRALKRGELIGLACDRAAAGNVREVMFFGCPARLPQGPVEMALRTGAPLLPVRALRLPDESFKITIEPPIDVESTGDMEADIARGMERLVRVMERWIAANPDQWLVSVPIWQQAEQP